MNRSGVYSTDVSDEGWAFVDPYLCLMKEDALQRVHSSRSVLNALRCIVRAGCPWRLLPNDLPPREIVHQQATRWLDAKVLEAMVADPRTILRPMADRAEEPTAAVLDARTLQGSIESEPRSGYHVHKTEKTQETNVPVGFSVFPQVLSEMHFLETLGPPQVRGAPTARRAGGISVA